MTSVLHTLDDLRLWRTGRGKVGLVPTMGGLHAGHRSLIERSVRENRRTIVSIFVNPTQFGNPEDLEKYPRTLDADTRLVQEAGADAIWAPEVATMYPAEFSTEVRVGGVTEDYEGSSRPGHFTGVATVVTMLLNQVRPDLSYFGEKDFQQLTMIRRMHRDLVLPGAIVPCPTVRDADGLALSSRNARLSEGGREAALVLNRALSAMRDHATEPENVHSPIRLSAMGAVLISAQPQVQLDYLEIVDPDSLEVLDRLTPGARALVAAEVEGVRLIDNLELIPG